MGDTKELKKIKRIYGEKFKNLCRDMFPIIIEQEGTLLSILEKRFSHNCNSLYEAITENGLEEAFKEYIFSEFDSKREEVREDERRTPYEILAEKGYDLIECKTEEEIQGFRKYYAPGEVLCTIYNGGRLATRDCFFAVRKDVDEIHREDFKNPNKGDEYSTSLLAIQFARDKTSTVQIISRYNHTVPNPNCTLGNDLNRLAPGLSQSFAKLLRERGVNLTGKNIESFEIPGYTLASDGKYYKYNMEIDGDYYCPGNIIISNGEVRSIGTPEKGLLIDNFYIDFQDKTIRDMASEESGYKDAFVDAFEEIIKIEVEKVEDTKKVIKVYIPDIEKPILLEIDRDNQIVGYTNPNIIKMDEGFLYANKALSQLSLPNLQEAGDGFLYANKTLSQLSLPNLQEAGDGFLHNNEGLSQLFLPNLQQVGNSFLYYNKGLSQLFLPNLQQVGNGFLYYNKGLSQLSLPNLRYVEDGFLSGNKALSQLFLPNLKEAGNSFLYYNEGLGQLSLPNLQKVGNGFLNGNKSLSQLSLPNLQEVGNRFLNGNKSLSQLSLPNLQKAGDYFMRWNRVLISVSTPKCPGLEESFREIVHRNMIDRIQRKREVVKEQEMQIANLEQEKKTQISKDVYEH